MFYFNSDMQFMSNYTFAAAFRQLSISNRTGESVADDMSFLLVVYLQVEFPYTKFPYKRNRL